MGGGMPGHGSGQNFAQLPRNVTAWTPNARDERWAAGGNTSGRFGANGSGSGGAYGSPSSWADDATRTAAIPNSFGRKDDHAASTRGGSRSTRSSGRSSLGGGGGGAAVGHGEAAPPPVVSIYDSKANESPARRSDGGGSARSLRPRAALPRHMQHEAEEAAQATPDNKARKRSLASPLGYLMDTNSPAQLDPFNQSGIHSTTDVLPDETWCTVFGFPPHSVSFVLDKFQAYGEIVRHVVGHGNANWMHIKYCSAAQCERALSKNGKIYDGSLKIGVVPCTDTALQADLATGDVRGTPSRHRTYRGGNARDYEVEPPFQANKAPRVEASFVSKFKEYVFGW